MPAINSSSICVFCCKLSNFNCEKCGDSYCSRKCQSDDWINHRTICFPMPKLKPLSGEKSDESQESFAEQIVCQIDGSEDEQTRLSTNGSDLGLQDTLVDTVFETMSELKEVLDEEDKLPDPANQATMEVYEEKEQTIQPEKGFNDEKLEKLTNKATNYTDLFMLENLKVRNWPKNKNIKVKLQRIVQYPNIISFIEDKKNIDELYKFMNDEIKTLRPAQFNIQDELPIPNEIVLAPLDYKLQRARVLDAEKSGIIVEFIDFGNMGLFATDEIYRIKDKKLQSKLSFEICSKLFIVDNMPKELDVKQEEILESRQMMITDLYLDDEGSPHCKIFGF